MPHIIFEWIWYSEFILIESRLKKYLVKTILEEIRMLPQNWFQDFVSSIGTALNILPNLSWKCFKNELNRTKNRNCIVISISTGLCTVVNILEWYFYIFGKLAKIKDSAFFKHPLTKIGNQNFKLKNIICKIIGC